MSKVKVDLVKQTFKKQHSAVELLLKPCFQWSRQPEEMKSFDKN